MDWSQGRMSSGGSVRSVPGEGESLGYEGLWVLGNSGPGTGCNGFPYASGQVFTEASTGPQYRDLGIPGEVSGTRH
jgi:hypothetical protein